ncbi:MAG: T9SS type A sorting domain-containing protein [Flavobacteriales bacterium]
MEDYPHSTTRTIDLSKVPTGLYLVRVSLANSTVTLRIIKE